MALVVQGHIGGSFTWWRPAANVQHPCQVIVLSPRRGEPFRRVRTIHRPPELTGEQLSNCGEESGLKIGLSAGATGPDVVRLHRILVEERARIAHSERDAHEFGPSTARALRAFQRRRGLTASGEVDDATCDVLVSIEQNITVDVTDDPQRSASPASDPDRGSVSVSLVDGDGEPIAAAPIRLFAESLRDAPTAAGGSFLHEHQVGERTTD
jgi:hypothetical protein